MVGRQLGGRVGRTSYMIAKFLKDLEALYNSFRDPPKTKYFFAKYIFGVPPSQYDRYRNDRAHARSMPCDVVANARKNSGLTWEKFGELWDKHFLNKQKQKGE